MKRTKLMRPVWQAQLARVNERAIRPRPTPRFGQRALSSAQALLLLLTLAALAFPNRAFAGPFAATTLNPATQTVNVGTPVTVDVVYAIGTAQYGTTYGIDFRIDFDATKLRVDSVTTGSTSPFTTLVAGKNVVDNTTGLLRYGATGPAVSDVTYTVARITFMPIAAGTSALRLREVSQYFTGYGPFGIDGLAVGGSITSKLTPVLTWANPAAINYGTEIGATQLNATANAPGTFSYTPSAGTVLDPGTQTLTVNFTPTDTVQYNSASKQVTLTVADTTPGVVVTWGSNSSGQMNVPAGLDGVTAVAAGRNHSVALKSDKTVVAWGQSSFSSVPAGLTNVIGIGAGWQHTVALKSGGTVVAWGVNDFGLTNVPAGLNNSVTAMASGSDHIVALKNDGTVVAWGDNSSGQTNVPAGLNNVIAIAAGGNYTLALKADKTVVAWGKWSLSVAGQDPGLVNVPAGLTNVTAIAAGRFHAVTVVNARPPLLSAITPAEALGGASNPVTLSLQGSGFTSTSAVRWDSWDQTTNLATTFVNSSNLTAQVPVSLLPELSPWNAIQTAQVMVGNPLGGVSAAKAFTVKAADVGPVQSKVAAPGQTSTVQTAPTAANQAGLSASFVNNSGSPATVTSAVYTSDPPFGTTIDTGGANGFVDLQISGADNSDSATVQFYYSSAITGTNETALVLKYFTGTVWTNLLSSGGAAPVKNMTNNLDGTVSGGRFTVVFNNTSTPKITELSGTVIAMSVNRAPAAQCNDVVVSADSACSANASIDNGSHDIDDGDTITVTQTPPGPYPVGATLVTLTVTDNHGASSSGTATVTVIDNTPPTLTVPAAILVSNDPGNCGAVVDYSVSATDNCSVTVVSTPASGSTFPKGTTTVTSVATDASGNTTIKAFTLTVNDTEAPSLTVPAPIVVSNTPGSCDAVVSFTVTAADNCSSVNAVSTPASGSTFPKGTTTVTSVATDAAGNTTTQAFTITVNDTEAPSLTVPSPMVVRAAAGHCDAAVSCAATATDNCPGVTIVNTPASGSTFPLGTNTVTSVATDTSGNTTTRTFTVTVRENVEIGNAVVVARNSVSIEQNAVIRSGDVIVNEIATGPVLKDGVELSVGQNATTPAGFALRANRLSIGQKAAVNSDLYYNTLVNKERNPIPGTRHSPWPLPVFCSLPLFESGPAGTQDISAKQGETVTLNEGNYRDVVLKQKSILLFTGGTYNLRTLDVGPNITVLFAGPSSVRIAGKFALDQKSTLGPKAGSGVGAADIVFYVNGSNAGAATIAQNCTVQGNFYAPNGTLSIEQNVKATGAFLARDVVVSQNAELSLASHFGSESSGGAGLLSFDSRAIGTSMALPVITRSFHMTEGGMELRFAGSPGSAYSVQFSPDLKTWETKSVVRAGPDGAIRFTDTEASETSVRFYRVVPIQSASDSEVGEAVNR